MTDEDAEGLRLRALLRGDEWFMQLLASARKVAAPNWAIGAGVIRDLVWDQAHGRRPCVVKDIDVAYFDPLDVRPDHDAEIEGALRIARPDQKWDAKNQAAIHLWYEARFGHRIDPITSLEDGISRWPETATAVAVRLEPSDELTIIAPLGLADLLGLVLRRNPRQVTREFFHERIARKHVAERWPHVRVISD